MQGTDGGGLGRKLFEACSGLIPARLWRLAGAQEPSGDVTLQLLRRVELQERQPE